MSINRQTDGRTRTHTRGSANLSGALLKHLVGPLPHLSLSPSLSPPSLSVPPSPLSSLTVLPLHFSASWNPAGGLCCELPQQVQAEPGCQTVFATLCHQKKAIHGPNLFYLSCHGRHCPHTLRWLFWCKSLPWFTTTWGLFSFCASPLPIEGFRDGLRWTWHTPTIKIIISCLFQQYS